MIASLSFFAISCTSISSEDSGSTGKTITYPKVLASYPGNATTGPFDTYTPNVNNVKAHFSIRFNKPMDKTTFTTSKIKCTGFDVPVNVTVLYDSSEDELLGFSVVKKATDSTANHKMAYRINATYTVTLDSSIADIQGYHLGKIYTFSFTPELYFRVVSFSYSDGDTLIPANLEVFFNSRLTPQIQSALSISPSLTNAWTLNASNDSCSAMCNVFGKVVPSTLYHVAVAASASDNYGNAIHAVATKSFQSPALQVETNKFPDGINSVNLATQFYLSFNYPMDTASVRAAFSFAPVSDINLSIGQNRLSFNAPNDFLPNTGYQLQLSTHAKTLSGYNMPVPISISFHTAKFSYNHVPADGASGVQPRSVIEIVFTGAINTDDNIDNAITVTPAFSHYVKVDQDYPGKSNHVYYIPQYPMAYGTKYTIRIDTTIHSIAGYTIAHPDSFSFTTGFSKK
jgi:hypothetical protein